MAKTENKQYELRGLSYSRDRVSSAFDEAMKIFENGF